MAENGEGRPSFEEVYETYKRRVYGLSCRLLGNSTEAEDATQEVFLRISRAYGRFRGDSSLFSWVYRITLNHCMERVRAAGRRKRRASEVALDDGEARVQIADRRAEGALERLEREETRKRIVTAIARLPEKLRRVVVMRDVEELSYEEIAEILDVSADAVGVRLYRGRELLRKILKA